MPKPTCAAATACARRSCRAGPGLDKWFFYPGFEPGTGGLIREPGLMDERQRFDGRAWLRARGLAPRPGERVASLFCYPSAPVGALLQALADGADAAAGHTRRRQPGAAGDAGAPSGAGHAALHRPALAEPERLRPAALGLRPELRARRGFLRACAVGRRALRLADLPAARRRPCRQAGRLSRSDAARRTTPSWTPPCAACGGPGTVWRQGPWRCPMPRAWRAQTLALARATAGPTRPGLSTARIRSRKALKLRALRAGDGLF